MNQYQQELKPPLTALMLTAFTLLLGEEGRDYLTFKRDMEAWELMGWIHRN
jgi:hypothetical protein